jgi:hypothetical protein
VNSLSSNNLGSMFDFIPENLADNKIIAPLYQNILNILSSSINMNIE